MRAPLSLRSFRGAAVLLSLAASACGASGQRPATPPAATVAVPPTTPSKASEASLGQLDLPVTGSPECQRNVREGMLALHSFLYDQAHESFAAGKKPTASDGEKAVASLDRLLELESTQQPTGPAWRRTPRETLGEWLLANGKPKDASTAFERELSARPNRALSLLLI